MPMCAYTPAMYHAYTFGFLSVKKVMMRVRFVTLGTQRAELDTFQTGHVLSPDTSPTALHVRVFHGFDALERAVNATVASNITGPPTMHLRRRNDKKP